MSDTASRLAALYADVRGDAKALFYVNIPRTTVIATNPEGHVVDALTPSRAAFIVALVNAWASGELTPPDPRIPRLQAVVEAARRTCFVTGDTKPLAAALDALLPGDTKEEGL
jgi:hypothetical protein